MLGFFCDVWIFADFRISVDQSAKWPHSFGRTMTLLLKLYILTAAIVGSKIKGKKCKKLEISFMYILLTSNMILPEMEEKSIIN